MSFVILIALCVYIHCDFCTVIIASSWLYGALQSFNLIYYCSVGISFDILIAFYASILNSPLGFRMCTKDSEQSLILMLLRDSMNDSFYLLPRVRRVL